MTASARVGMVCLHTCPFEQPGAGDAGDHAGAARVGVDQFGVDSVAGQPGEDELRGGVLPGAAGDEVGALILTGLGVKEMSVSAPQIPGVKAAESWPALLAGWKAALEGLAEGFASGDARVDPRDGRAVVDRLIFKERQRGLSRVPPRAR